MVIIIAVAILGAVTGVISLFLHFLSFRKNRPIVNVDFHKTRIDKKEREITFELKVHNRGNLSTSIHNFYIAINKLLKDSPNVWSLKKDESFFSGLMWREKKKRVEFPYKLDSNCTEKWEAGVKFLIPEWDFIQRKKELDCLIVIDHTHGHLEKTKKIK